MLILVTGATGTVGRHVVEQLVNKGIQVRAVSRNPLKAKLPKEVEVVQGDLNVPRTLENAFHGVDGMYLITSSDQPDVDLQTDAEIVELAEKYGVKRVSVLVGYEGSVEEALKQSKLEWTLLKPNEFMANVLDDWRESIRKEQVVREPFGDALSARVHEADIATVAVASLLEDGHHGKSYHLTGPEVLSRVEAVQVISEGIGQKIRFIELTEEEAREKWKDVGYSDQDIEFFVQMGKNPPVMGRTVSTAIEQVTGRPAKSFVEWVSEHKHAFL